MLAQGSRPRLCSENEASHEPVICQHFGAMSIPQVQFPVAPSSPQTCAVPTVSPMVVVSANEAKKPADAATVARSLVSILRKPPTDQVCPTLREVA